MRDNLGMIPQCAKRLLVAWSAPKNAQEVLRARAGVRSCTVALRPLHVACVFVALAAACSGHPDVSNVAVGVKPPGDGGDKGGTTPPTGVTDPSCSDLQLNNQETDIDCGGPLCSPCDIDRRCGSRTDCATGVCEDSLCVLASSPPFWLPSVPMTTARGGHAAAILVSSDRHELFVLGGFADKVLDTYEVFDPRISSWISGKLPGAPCCRASATTGPDGKVYFVYGDQHQTWVYDSFTWRSSLASPPPGCVHAGSALGSDGLLYVLCSHDSQLPPNGLMRYDTANDSWATLKPAPTAAVNPPWVTSSGSRIYVSSTSDGNNYPFDAYDLDTRLWLKLSQPPVPSVIAGAPDGRVYAVAGFDARAATSTAEVRAYSAETNRWTAVAPLKLSRYDHAVTVGPDGRLYALGGVANGSTPTDSVEAYGPVVSISPDVVDSGDTIRLSGHNFAAHANVRIRMATPLVNDAVVGTTNAEGALPSPVSLHVVDAPSGSHAITVVDDKSRYPVTVRFRVR